SSRTSAAARASAFAAPVGRGRLIFSSARSSPNSIGRALSMNSNLPLSVVGCFRFAPTAAPAFLRHTVQIAFAFATHAGFVAPIAIDVAIRHELNTTAKARSVFWPDISRDPYHNAQNVRVAQVARLVSAPDAPHYGWIEFSEPREG